jgi:exopolyphosphatase/pppGpp-phosphohydrolase
MQENSGAVRCPTRVIRTRQAKLGYNRMRALQQETISMSKHNPSSTPGTSGNRNPLLPAALAVAGFVALLVAMANLNSERTNVLHGVVHRVLFATYVMLIFD